MFTGLSPATDHTFYVRFPATASDFASEYRREVFRTLGVGATLTAADLNINFAARAVSFAAGIQVSGTAGFDTLLNSGAAIQPGQTLFARTAAVAEVSVAGPVFSMTLPSTGAAPEIPEFAVTEHTIIFEDTNGLFEFRFGADEGEPWRTSPEFLGLPSERSFTIYVRYRATDSAFVSSYAYVEIVTRAPGGNGGENGGENGSDENGGGSGCGSTSIAGGFLALALIGGALLLVKKRP